MLATKPVSGVQRLQAARPTALHVIARHKQQPMNSQQTSIGRILGTAAAVTSASLLVAGSALAFAPETAEVFGRSCAGCHAGGGNIVAAGATLFPADLAKNGVDSPEALYNIIYSGKGKMPGYGKDCAPKGACTFAKRFTDEEVKDLASYVLERAGENWK